MCEEKKQRKNKEKKTKKKKQRKKNKEKVKEERGDWNGEEEGGFFLWVSFLSQ